MKRLYRKIVVYVRLLLRWAKKITLPGFDGLPMYDVFYFFFKGIYEGSITTRAAAIAFSFYLAIFPAIIFVFTLIPYIPIDNFQEQLFSLVASLLPHNAFLSIQETLQDIIMNQRGGLLSFGFFAALIFSTNGINSMMDAFNATWHHIETRTWLAQRLIATILVVILFTLTLLAVSMIVMSEWTMNYLVDHHLLNSEFTIFLLGVGKWIVILALFFFSFSFLYYMAPAKKSRWRFISAGSSLATILSVLTSLGFSFYINNFGRYNTLYGSIGTILVILMWLYVNSIILLIGFELNVSITGAGNSTGITKRVRATRKP